MRQFDLEKFKSGSIAITRDGKRKCKFIGTIEPEDSPLSKREILFEWTEGHFAEIDGVLEDGRRFINRESDLDIFTT